jgi:uncharacterized protein YeaO (DUF488 family)
MYEKMMEDWMKFQQKMTPDLNNIQSQAVEGMSKMQNFMFNNAIQNVMSSDTEKWTKFMENSIKFQKAYIAQQQSMLDMMESMTENAKILSNK